MTYESLNYELMYFFTIFHLKDLFVLFHPVAWNFLPLLQEWSQSELKMLTVSINSCKWAVLTFFPHA